MRQRMTSLEANTVRTFILFWNIQYNTQSFFFVTVLLLGFIIFINVLVYIRWQVHMNFRGEKYIGLIPVLPRYD